MGWAPTEQCLQDAGENMPATKTGSACPVRQAIRHLFALGVALALGLGGCAASVQTRDGDNDCAGSYSGAGSPSGAGGPWILFTFLFSTTTSSTCAGGDSAFTQEPAYRYVAANRHSLTGELPRGGGPHLRALGTLLGCDAGAPLAAMARKRYAALLPEHGGEAYHLLRNMQLEIAFDPALVWRCGWV